VTRETGPCPVAGRYLLIILGLLVHGLNAQTPAQTSPEQATSAESPKAPPQQAVPQDPLNRLSPQSAMSSFLEICRSGNFERAARYLDLDRLSREQRLTDGPRLAQQLGQLLDRDGDFDLAALSKDPRGDLSDGLPPDRERIATYDAPGKPLQLELERSTRREGLVVWIVSSESVALIPQLMQITSDSPIEKYLPTVLVSWNLGGTPIWRWIALLLLGIAVAAVAKSLARLGISLLHPLLRTFAPKVEESLLDAFVGPVRLLLAGVFLRAGVEWVGPPALLRLYLARFCTLLIILGTAWAVAKLVDLIIGQMRRRQEARHNTFLRSALPLTSRVVKITIFVFAVMAVIGSWGYSTNTILAGLGIGGIAIALAAQKTIENLFGGVAVVSDRPVTVGDFCKFGDRVGTVEDIGLRSTWVRTLDRTLVAIPNAEFSSMVLENFSRRDKVWFHPTMNLRRDTEPDQVRRVLDSIRQILKGHPKVETGAIPVRFIGVGSYSLDIEIFAYIRTADYDEFLQLQQDLLLRIMDAISAAGTALAIPTQASVSYSDVSENHDTPRDLSAARRIGD
jgi:MscS family membrane protein